MTIRNTACYDGDAVRDASLSPIMITMKPKMILQKRMTQQQVQHQQQQQRQPQPANDGDNDDSISLDVSSLHSFGSIRPDPKYDPARDPTNPMNQNTQFIPPSEITVKTIRGRRRKTMGRSGGRKGKEEEERQECCYHSRSPMIRRPPVDYRTPAVQQQQQQYTQHQNQQPQPQPLNQHHVLPSSTLRLSPIPQTLMMPSLNYHPSSSKISKSTSPTALLADELSSEMFLSDDAFHNDRIYSTNSITIDDNDDDDNDEDGEDDINDDVIDDVEQQQQQHKQRKGMIRREFGRKIFALTKKASILNNNSHHRRDYSGSSNVPVINGKDIDRVFGVGDTVAKENLHLNSNELTNSSSSNNNNSNRSCYSSGGGDSSNGKYNDNNKHHPKTNNSWHTNLFTTKNIFVKKGRDKNFESSTVV